MPKVHEAKMIPEGTCRATGSPIDMAGALAARSTRRSSTRVCAHTRCNGRGGSSAYLGTACLLPPARAPAGSTQVLTLKESRTLRSDGPFFFHSSEEALISST